MLFTNGWSMVYIPKGNFLFISNGCRPGTDGFCFLPRGTALTWLHTSLGHTINKSPVIPVVWIPNILSVVRCRGAVHTEQFKFWMKAPRSTTTLQSSTDFKFFGREDVCSTKSSASHTTSSATTFAMTTLSPTASCCDSLLIAVAAYPWSDNMS